jgi:Virulence factor BrkB
MGNVFSIVFRTKARGFLAQKLMAMGMVVILAILLPLSLAASSLVTADSSAFRSVLLPPLSIVLSIVAPLTSLFVLWVLFLLICMVVPNTKVPFRIAWRGAGAAALLFALFDLLFPLYFTLFLTGNGKYGAVAASLLVLVAWLWFFALVTVIGAQINAVAMGIKPTRYDLPRTLVQEYEQEIAPPPEEAPARTPSMPPSKEAAVTRAPWWPTIRSLTLNQTSTRLADRGQDRRPGTLYPGLLRSWGGGVTTNCRGGARDVMCCTATFRPAAALTCLCWRRSRRCWRCC